VLVVLAVELAVIDGVLLGAKVKLGDCRGVCVGLVVIVGELVIVADGCAVGAASHVTVKITPPGGATPTST
jgi:hypothetical protein